MRVVAALILAIILVSAALAQPAGTTIVPGRALGPVTLGMPAGQARRVVAQFNRATGCDIDLLVARGVVIAAGSPWGGCLDLQLPSDTPPTASVGPIAHRVAPPIVGIGGPPAALVHAFGPPLVVRQGADSAILIFTNGLVAHVGATRVRGGMVTYLAVQAAGVASVPQIGYFVGEGEGPAR
jgi:hypothetical protein